MKKKRCKKMKGFTCAWREFTGNFGGMAISTMKEW